METNQLPTSGREAIFKEEKKNNQRNLLVAQRIDYLVVIWFPHYGNDSVLPNQNE